MHENITAEAVGEPLIELAGPESGNAATLALEGVVIHDNDTTFFLLSAKGEAELELAWSSIADNVVRATFALFGSFTSGSSGYPRIDVNASIIWQPGMPISRTDGAAQFFFDCNIAHSIDTPGQITRSLAADPIFLAPSEDDYHISADSPAVDFCEATASPPIDPDLDGQIRGVATTPGTATPYDAGADEALDRIFFDRFSG